MNIREQIANNIRQGIEYYQEPYTKIADAILALLQPRLLTKDEAYVAGIKWDCSNPCRSCDYQDDCHALMSKLELLQMDSE